ncbi:hypothetical protein L369_04712 [Enterobacter sp. MGH 23]|jgi:hypothetical protein|nr:hypothetical protein L369_04712 [Enterobacter sp. MGH 23]
MCDLCRLDGNYFHTPECVYHQLVSDYTLRELLSPDLRSSSPARRRTVPPDRVHPVAPTCATPSADTERPVP